MIKNVVFCCLLFTLLGCEPPSPDVTGSYVESRLSTSRLPSGNLEYAVWEPSDVNNLNGLPLIIALHGGGGSRDYLKGLLPTIQQAMALEKFPAAIWSTPTANRSFYMNYQDGSADWESVIVEEYLPELMSRYDISGPRQVVIVGVSMGGMGGLRIAFKYPEKFGAVAVLEPAVEAVLNWVELTTTDTFYREDMYPILFGDPVDAEYWEANHPPAIAHSRPRTLDQLSIYFEVGDMDELKLYRGGEFLHRILFDHGVQHEFRLVRGAGHIGEVFMQKRFEDVLDFVNRYFHPVEENELPPAMKEWVLGLRDINFDADIPLNSHRPM
jgi:S-formylglutathione hydrolase